MLRVLIGIVLAVAAADLQAQTVPSLEYDYTRPLAEVQGYTQVVQVNGTTVAGGPTCTAVNPTLTRCTIALPTLPATGTNTVSISTTAGGQTVETRLTGVSLANLPANATNPKLKVTITIAIGS